MIGLNHSSLKTAGSCDCLRVGSDLLKTAGRMVIACGSGGGMIGSNLSLEGLGALPRPNPSEACGQPISPRTGKNQR